MLEELWRIDVKDDGDIRTVVATGELDMSTSIQLTEAFSEANGHGALVCDVTGLTFIDSAGVQALLALQRNEPTRFALSGTSPCVERVLNLAGVAQMFRRA